jgi:hypothetical protein
MAHVMLAKKVARVKNSSSFWHKHFNNFFNIVLIDYFFFCFFFLFAEMDGCHSGYDALPSFSHQF